MLLTLCIVYLALLVVLLAICEQKSLLRWYLPVKTAVSLGFLAVCGAAFATRTPHTDQATHYFAALLLCFVLCLAGDVALALAHARPGSFRRWFLCGVVSFLLAHIGFCAVFLLLSAAAPRFAAWLLLPPVAVVCITFALTRSPRFHMRRLRVPVLVYSFFVALMCVAGVRFSVSGGSALVAVGSVLFFLSDFVLLFLYFHRTQRRYWRAANLALYYLGMLCLALSV